MEKCSKNKGFTLAELLIVVAIIGVLVAISIPVYSKLVQKARMATIEANLRSIYSLLCAEQIEYGKVVSEVAVSNSKHQIIVTSPDGTVNTFSIPVDNMTDFQIMRTCVLQKQRQSRRILMETKQTQADLHQ